jgi:hypothetical protein
LQVLPLGRGRIECPSLRQEERIRERDLGVAVGLLLSALKRLLLRSLVKLGETRDQRRQVHER